MQLVCETGLGPVALSRLSQAGDHTQAAVIQPPCPSPPPPTPAPEGTGRGGGAGGKSVSRTWTQSSPSPMRRTFMSFMTMDLGAHKAVLVASA